MKSGLKMSSVVLVATIALASAQAAPANKALAAKGQPIFAAQCGICHGIAAGATGIGPSLHGVVGRKAGSLAGYNYSSAMKATAYNWTPTHLKTYLAAPSSVIPNNKMPYAGLKNPAQLAAVIAYLESLK